MLVVLLISGRRHLAHFVRRRFVPSHPTRYTFGLCPPMDVEGSTLELSAHAAHHIEHTVADYLSTGPVPCLSPTRRQPTLDAETLLDISTILPSSATEHLFGKAGGIPQPETVTARIQVLLHGVGMDFRFQELRVREPRDQLVPISTGDLEIDSIRKGEIAGDE